MEASEIRKNAREIAKENLRACYLNGKVIASPMRFSDYWARDTFFSILGMLEIGDFDVAKNSLKLFLDNQRGDGKIARKFVLDYNFLKYVFKKSILRKNPQVVYSSLVPPFSTMDGNSLCIIAFSRYFEKTGDVNFTKEYFEKLKIALDWYENKKNRSGLVREYFLSNWMDTIFKSGSVLYSNVLYAKALADFSDLAREINIEEVSQKYFEKYEKIKEEINKEFWNGEFFNDIVGHKKYFDSAGNASACFFDIASSEKKKKVLEYFEKIKKEKLLPTVFPKYSFWKVNPITFIFGMSEYHNNKSWIWIDSFVAGAELGALGKEKANERMNEIAQIIVKNGAVHEVFHADGAPYNPKFWQSAVPFAWNSGVFLYIDSLLIEK